MPPAKCLTTMMMITGWLMMMITGWLMMITG